VLYRGSALSSRLRCYWKARVWDESGRRSNWSQPAFWEMGLLRQEDWQGRWIGSGAAQERRPASGFFKSTNELSQVNQQAKVDGRSTLLRKTFVLYKPVLQARLYVTGLGYYELSCNGRRIGDHVLAACQDQLPQMDPLRHLRPHCPIRPRHQCYWNNARERLV